MRNNTHVQREWLTRIFSSWSSATSITHDNRNPGTSWIKYKSRFCYLGTELCEPLEPGHKGILRPEQKDSILIFSGSPRVSLQSKITKTDSGLSRKGEIPPPLPVNG